jgi:hypothetical protein
MKQGPGILPGRKSDKMAKRAKVITLYKHDFKTWSETVPTLGRRLAAANKVGLDIVLVKLKFNITNRGVNSMVIYTRKGKFSGGEFDGYLKHFARK